jgi:carbonic anhydrase/acetyltransferase-like protein (isoleucine patch superfamily)
VGNNVFIGVNATLRDGVKVLDETLVGAGALIMKDTMYRGVYMPEGTEAHRVTSNKLKF